MTEPRAPGPSDEELARRYRDDPGGRAGRAAAEELFERYRERVYLWCVRRLRDHDRALDAAQEVMISAFRALGSFEGRSRYSSWLFAIARHRCLRVLRPQSLVRDEEADLDAFADPAADPAEELVEREEEETLIRLASETLEPHERMALWLRCGERLPVDEVTRRLGLTTASGARSVLQSARRKLREALARERREEGRIP